MVFFRYVTRTFLGYVFISLVFFVGLFVLFDFIDKSKHYFPGFNPDSWSIFLFYFYQLPSLAIQSAPIASLAASGFTLYSLGVSNEMAAMLSFGYSPARLLRPLFCSGLIFLSFLFFLSEFVVPESSKKVQYLKKVVFEEKKHSFINKTKWSRENNTFYSYTAYDPKLKRFYALKIIHLDQNFHLQRVEEVKQANYLEKEKLWRFSGVKNYQFIRNKEDFSIKESKKETRLAKLPISADLMKVERRHLRELSLKELSSILERNKSNGMNLLELHIAWNTKLAYLSVSFLFVFGAFPLAFRFGRRKESVFDFASLLILGFGYWLLFSFLRAVLLSGSINVIVGSWLPNFLLVLYLSFRIQRTITKEIH